MTKAEIINEINKYSTTLLNKNALNRLKKLELLKILQILLQKKAILNYVADIRKSFPSLSYKEVEKITNNTKSYRNKALTELNTELNMLIDKYKL